MYQKYIGKRLKYLQNFFQVILFLFIMSPRGSGNINPSHLRGENVIPFRNEGISSCNLSINLLKKITECKKYGNEKTEENHTKILESIYMHLRLGADIINTSYRPVYTFSFQNFVKFLLRFFSYETIILI